MRHWYVDFWLQFDGRKITEMLTISDFKDFRVSLFLYFKNDAVFSSCHILRL